MSVGGVAKGGIFMHPPYNGGVGNTLADFGPLLVPYSPSEFRASIGIRDGGDASDGVRFMLEIVDARGARHRLIDEIGVQKGWRDVRADLSAYAGHRVHVLLIADVGPNDNATADWGCWGEPRIRLSTPRVTTEITEASAGAP